MKLQLDMLIHGVYIVSAQYEGKRGGLAVSWATQVARGHLLICVGKQSATRELILASKAFGLSMLTQEQLDIARVFGAQSSRKVDKFKDVAYHTGETGSPLLDACAATFDCKVVNVYDYESKKLIVGQIVAIERLQEKDEPFIYKEEDY